MKKLSKKHISFVQEYLDCNSIAEAYMKVYKQDNRKIAGECGWKLLQEKNNPQVYAYYVQERDLLVDIMRDRNTITKEILVEDLLNLKHIYNEMLQLGSKMDLTGEEQLRFSRLTQLLKGSDITKVNDQLAKLIGAYAPEKVEVKQVQWQIDFGGSDITNDSDSNDLDELENPFV